MFPCRKQKRQHSAAVWVFHSDQKNRKHKCCLVWDYLMRVLKITAKIVNRTTRKSLGAEAAGACTFRLFDFLGRQLASTPAIQYTVRHDLAPFSDARFIRLMKNRCALQIRQCWLGQKIRNIGISFWYPLSANGWISFCATLTANKYSCCLVCHRFTNALPSWRLTQLVFATCCSCRCSSSTLSEQLLRNHSDRSQPCLHQLRPCGGWKLRASEPKSMTALGVQMHLHGNSSLFQCSIVA